MMPVDMRPDRISLFPLNVVLFPGELLPLHIFEPRYRRMVRECLDAKAHFGMLLALPNGVAHVGCSAEILEVTKRYDDGRMDILAQGKRRFEIQSLNEDKSFLQGEVTFFDERSGLVMGWSAAGSLLGRSPPGNGFVRSRTSLPSPAKT